MLKRTIVALCLSKGALAINWSMGALSQCGEVYLTWDNATDGPKSLLCVPVSEEPWVNGDTGPH
jgi:hypothetical protein